MSHHFADTHVGNTYSPAVYHCSSSNSGMSHCKESVCTGGYCLPWKSFFVKLLLDLEGHYGYKILLEDTLSLWKPLRFNPVSPTSDITKWCAVKSLLLFHSDSFLLTPFPTARAAACRPICLARVLGCFLSLPASSLSLPGPDISFAKGCSSSY